MKIIMGKLLKFLTLSIVILLIGVSIFIVTFDANKYKGEIVSIVENMTGRSFEISGDVKLGISLIPTMVIKDVKFGNSEWSSMPDMIKAKSFKVQFSLIQLVVGEVKIRQLVLDSADILLETSKQGKGNWGFQTAQEKNSTDVPTVDISELNIKNSKLTYKDGVTGKQTSVFFNKFTAETDVFGRSLDVLVKADYNDVAVDLKGKFGSLASLTGNSRFPVNFKAEIGDAEIRIKGKIAEPLNLKGVDLDINFEASSLEPFAKILARELPDVGAIQLAGHVSESNGFYKLESVTSRVLDSEVSVDGQVSAKTPAENFDLQIRLDSETLASFNTMRDIIGKELPDTGPFNFKGHISKQEGFYQLDTINASLDKDHVFVNGKLSAQDPLKGFDLEIKFNTENLANYNFLSDHDLPYAGPLQVSGLISENNGAYQLRSVNAELPETKISIDGILTGIKQPQGSNLKINFQSTSLEKLNEFTAFELPSLGSVTLIASVSDQMGSYQLQNITFKTGKTDLNGKALINFTGDHPMVDATLESDLVDLTPFTTEYEKEPSEKEEEKQDKLFSSEPLQLEGLKVVDARLNIKAKQVKTADHTLDNVVLDMDLNDGKLVLTKLNTNIGSALLDMNMTLDASSGKVDALDTNISLRNFQPSSLPDLRNKISGASTDLVIKAQGSGASVAEIMAGLNGNVLLTSGEGEITSEELDMVGADIFVSTLNFLNPFSKKDNSRKLLCGVVNLDINDGIARTDRGIALSMQRMDIVGSGIIDLKTEKLNIAIRPRSKGGLGISTGNLAELVKISGTLVEPSIAPDTIAAIKKAASVGAAFATAGISMLVQGLLGKAIADGDPCATARNMKMDTATSEETITRTE